LWGREDVVRERFGDGVTIRTQKRIVLFNPQMGAAAAVDFFREYFGPTRVAFSRLDAEGQERMRADLVDLWVAFNRHILHVLRAMPESALPHEIAVIEGYVRHVNHHLAQILS